MKNKINYLQGIRAYAFLSVFAAHCYLLNKSVLQHAGQMGVGLFFMLSGYLAIMFYKPEQPTFLPISKLIQKIKKFYLLYLITFVAAINYSFDAYPIKSVFKKIGLGVINLCMLQSWIPSPKVYFSYNGVSWYISTYIFLLFIGPFLCKMLRSLKPNQIKLGMLLIVILHFSIAFIFQGKEIEQWITFIFPPVRTLDFILGILVYLLANSKKEEPYSKLSNAWTIIITIIATCVIIVITRNSSSAMCYTAFWSIPSILLLYLLASSNPNNWITKYVFSNPIAVFIGNISLELFLIHQIVLNTYSFHFHKEGHPIVLIYFILLLVSIFLAFLYQKIQNSFKKK